MPNSAVPLESYTLTYLEPELVCRNPVKFDYERTTHHIKAPGDKEAADQAFLFVAQGVVSCNNVNGKRIGKELKRDHPFFIVLDESAFAVTNRIKTVAA